MDDEFASREAFQLLADETRLGIVHALAARIRDCPEDPVLGFSELRRRVGLRDSGNFNYHLDKLTGRFVRETEGGYRIAPAGLEVVAAVAAGTYGDGRRRGPAEMDDPCPICAAPLVATYEDGLLCVECPDGHEFRNTLPPGAVADRDIEGIVDLLTLTTLRDLEFAVENVCPFCYARLSWDVDPDGVGEVPEFETGCDRCGVRVELPAVAPLLWHPVGAAFYYDRGVDPRSRPPWAPEFYDPVAVATATDPLCVELDVELDGDRLRAYLDGSLSVASIERP